MKQQQTNVFLLTVVLFAWPATSATLRADLTHIDSGRGFTPRELLRRMVVRSRARAAKLCPSGHHGANPVTAPVVRGGGPLGSSEYLMHFQIGMQHVALEVDTGSDLIWTQCQPCLKCFKQPFPKLDTAASDTMRAVACSDPLCEGFSTKECFLRGCTYQYFYGDKSTKFGHLAKDSFTFHGKGGGAVSVPDLAFGCAVYSIGNYFNNESGIAGFSRGPLSLPSQLKVGSFSYCLTTVFESKSSPVFLPADLGAHATGPVQSTPFVPNPPHGLYYLSLKGVTVGKTRLPVPESVFALRADGSGGTVIDSGTGMTNLPQAAFGHLRSAFVAQVPLPALNNSDNGDDGSVAQADLPLRGHGLDLPRENYMADFSGALCVAIVAAGDHNEPTLIGNFQQQNMHMVHDLVGNKLFIVPAQCDKM